MTMSPRKNNRKGRSWGGRPNPPFRQNKSQSQTAPSNGRNRTSKPPKGKAPPEEEVSVEAQNNITSPETNQAEVKQLHRVVLDQEAGTIDPTSGDRSFWRRVGWLGKEVGNFFAMVGAAVGPNQGWHAQNVIREGQGLEPLPHPSQQHYNEWVKYRKLRNGSFIAEGLHHMVSGPMQMTVEVYNEDPSGLEGWSRQIANATTAGVDLDICREDNRPLHIPYVSIILARRIQALHGLHSRDSVTRDTIWRWTRDYIQGIRKDAKMGRINCEDEELMLIKSIRVCDEVNVIGATTFIYSIPSVSEVMVHNVSQTPEVRKLRELADKIRGDPARL